MPVGTSIYSSVISPYLLDTSVYLVDISMYPNGD